MQKKFLNVNIVEHISKKNINKLCLWKNNNKIERYKKLNDYEDLYEYYKLNREYMLKLIETQEIIYYTSHLFKIFFIYYFTIMFFIKK